jgi:hypothetical protein
MQPDELAVRTATEEDASFIFALRAHPDTIEFLAVSDQTGTTYAYGLLADAL